MFWNEPNLYGATFPFKDIPQTAQFPFTPFMGQTPYLHTPFMGAIPPVQTYPKFVPPQFLPPTPYLYNVPTPTFNPIDPATFYATQLNTPFVNPPINYNWVRPFF